MSQRASFLKPDDRVAIVATARKVSLEEIMPFKNILESWGLEVVLGKTINTNACFQLADSDINRVKDLQYFLDATNISAVFCARGGYGNLRIVDMLDWKNFLQHPKWLIGYSDFSVLLTDLYFRHNYQSIHGTMAINITAQTPENSLSITSLKQCLFGHLKSIKWKANINNIHGECSAEVVCGNLSVLYSLLGSQSFGQTEGKILVLEDLDEYGYHIDRMFRALKRAGKLNNLAALVLGSFTDLHDNEIPFGKTLTETVLETIEDCNYPVAFDFPLGHIGEQNMAIVNGARAKLLITSHECFFIQN